MVTFVEFSRKCYWTAICSGKHVFRKFKSISQQGFSLKFKAYHYNEALGIWTGMVNPMMQPAEYSNKALTEWLFTIKSRSKGGVIIEEDTVEDVSKFEQDIARTNSVAVVNAGAISGGKIMFKEQPQVPNGLDSIMQLAQASLTKNSVDPAFIGDMDDKDQSGILYKRRLRQVISKLGRPFDALSLYAKEKGRLMLDLIPIWAENNRGGAVNITGEDGFDQWVEISEKSINAEFSVSIQEAPQTPEDKQETAQIIGTYADKLGALGDVSSAKVLYAQSINMLNLDGDIKRNIQKVLMPQTEQIDPMMVQQLQARVQELEGELTRSQVEQVQSQTRKNLADADAKTASIGKLQADTVKALEDARRTQAETDLVSTGNYEKATVSI